MSAIFQGFGGSLSDREVWAADLRLADLAEPLGFESIWSVEHHFTDYTMCPDVLQFLTYMAGRTSTVKLGSMVLVLPWHDPVRAAEQIVMLDHMSNGRLILGLGRGTGKVEFDGFRVEMAYARQQFKEAAEAILGALETGVMEYHGEYVDQPRVELHPSPLATFKGRTYSATVSPESAEIMAKLGTGVLIVPQKPWRMVKEETETVPLHVSGGDRRGAAATDRRRVDLRRRERRPRRGAGPHVVERVLGLGHLALRVRQAAPQVDAGLRVPRPHVRPVERARRLGEDDRVLHRPPAVRDARAGVREDNVVL